MDALISFSNQFFKPILSLGGPPVMFIVLTLLALIMKVKFTRALEGGMKLAIALTGMGTVIGILTGAFAPALQGFVKSTGIQLSITDVGWAPLATITWGSTYTLYFLMLLVILNIVMLAMNKTNTLDVDIFDVWHLSVVGLLVMYYSNDNLFLASFLVLFIGILKFINSDLMKPTFNELLNMPESNPTTTTHLNFMFNPIAMLLNKLFDIFLPFIDKYDFDAATLNKKIGFWGSKFAIGCYLGVLVGILGQQEIKSIFSLAFTGGVCLELFSFMGSWFIAAVEPLSQGITNFMSKKFSGRQFNIGIDWPFLASRAEIWAAANVLAPIMLIEALILPGNGVLPLGGIIAMGMTPSLLVVTRGKMMRMIIIGALMLPVFLLAGTVIAEFATKTALTVGAFPPGLAATQMITHSTLEGPVEKFIAIAVGKFGGNMTIENAIKMVSSLVVYLGLFLWYAKQMKKRNIEIEAKKQN